MQKVAVFDLDNTLWDGIFLEQGAVPSLYPGRKDLLEELAGRGVLLSVASHNRMEDVQAALHALDLDHIMLYPQGDLSASKADMMQRIMESLQLTKREDLVLIDDDRGNIDEVRQAGFEAWNVENLDACVLVCFTKAEYTEDDRLRVQRYKDEERRDRAAQAYGSDRTAFLASLGMELSIRNAALDDMPRIIDLVERSNRFSALAEHYDALDLDYARKSGTLYAVRVSDKYGDYGLSAVFEDIAGVMPLLVVSCRLAGKGIGSALVGWVINRNLGMVRGEWIATPYNASVSELFKWYGCTLEQVDSKVIAARSADGLVELPSWIKLV